MKFVIGHAQADQLAARAVAQAAADDSLLFQVRDGVGDVVFGDHLIRIALWTTTLSDPALSGAMERFLLVGNLRRIAVLFPGAPPLTERLGDAGQIVLNWSDQFANELGVAVRVLTSSKFDKTPLERVSDKTKR